MNLDSKGNSTSTRVKTTVRFDSSLGNTARKRISSLSSSPTSTSNTEEEPARKGILSGLGLAGWGKESVQRTIEQLGARKMVDHVGSSTKGMQLVLNRLRNIGLIGSGSGLNVNEESLRDERRWKAIWRRVKEEIPAEGDI